MHSWSDLAVYLAAMREGSASRAAAVLDVSVSTVTRRLAALESDLGAALFARTPAGLQPTPAAHALRSHAEAVERSVHAGRAAVQSLDTTPRGQVCIALPDDMMLLVLFPRFARFIDAHPELTVVFDSGREVADLTRREADIAVRVRLPTHADELLSQRVRTVEWAVFATAEVLSQIADPSDPEQHRWIGMVDGMTESGIGGFIHQLSGGRYALRCASAIAQRHAAAAGLGTAVMPRLFGDLTPSLIQVPIAGPPPMPLYLVTHRAVRDDPRVAATWEALQALLGQGDPLVERTELTEALARHYGVHPGCDSRDSRE